MSMYDTPARKDFLKRAFNSKGERVPASLSLDCRSIVDGKLVLHSLVQQHHKDEADINLIVSRYLAGSLLPQGATPPRYLDLSTAPDFLQAQLILAKGTEAFESLPAHVRARFSNSVPEFLDFVSDPASGPELLKLGLATFSPSAPASSPERSSPASKPELSVKAPKAPQTPPDAAPAAS